MEINSTTINQYGANLFMWAQQSFNLKANSFIIIEYSSDQCEYLEVRLVKKSDIENANIEGNDINGKIFSKVKNNKVETEPPEELQSNDYTPIPVVTGYSIYNTKEYYLPQQIDMRGLAHEGEYYIVIGFHVDFRSKKLFKIKVYSQEEVTSTEISNIKKEI